MTSLQFQAMMEKLDRIVKLLEKERLEFVPISEEDALRVTEEWWKKYEANDKGKDKIL